MISYINIKNIALIRELSLELKDGLNILSGETGAGKSIIIDSINFVLGDRADRGLIRYGESTARVEVVFDKIVNYSEIKQQLEDLGIDCEDETVIVARQMSNDRSECRINGRVVTLNVLRGIVSSLVDIHSQNEHQSLMKPANHITMLDGFAPETEELKAEFRKTVAQYKDICTKIDGFMSADERERKMGILGYQLEEIERVNWCDENEEGELNTAKNRFYNAQKIADSIAAAAGALDDDNMGAVFSIKNSLAELRTALKFDESLNPLYERLESLSIEASDILDGLREKLDEAGESVDIERIEKRLAEIKTLKRKYGATIEEIERFRDEAQAELDYLNDAEAQLVTLEKKKDDLSDKITIIADKLHNIRVKISKSFSKAIRDNLNELGMKNCTFEVKIDYPENDVVGNINANGADTVEFMMSPNVGEPLKPLHKIASGGEMSRLMLALKNIIAEVDKIGTLIFDEIDTGISGVIAKVVAKKLYDIAKSRQVIAITHLPQLASMADVNFLIEKKVVQDKTVTFVKELVGDEVFGEIMRLTGAVENSEVGLSNAKELKEWANLYKTAK